MANFKKDDLAVSKQDKYLVTPRGQRRMRKTTKGWKLLVIWKDQSKIWIPLKDLKESNPTEVADFEKARCIEDEPKFCWWVPYVMKNGTILFWLLSQESEKPHTSTVFKYQNPEKKRFVLIKITVIVSGLTNFRKR